MEKGKGAWKCTRSDFLPCAWECWCCHSADGGPGFRTRGGWNRERLLFGLPFLRSSSDWSGCLCGCEPGERGMGQASRAITDQPHMPIRGEGMHQGECGGDPSKKRPSVGFVPPGGAFAFASVAANLPSVKGACRPARPARFAERPTMGHFFNSKEHKHNRGQSTKHLLGSSQLVHRENSMKVGR